MWGTTFEGGQLTGFGVSAVYDEKKWKYKGEFKNGKCDSKCDSLNYDNPDLTLSQFILSDLTHLILSDLTHLISLSYLINPLYH